ncbi:hypothetical protein MMC30_002375 [Trapelia coarctata]|nr:hypothetical protein [Trapelia coarctata]
MHLPLRHRELERRATQASNTWVWIGLSIASVACLFLIIVYFQIHNFRRKYPNPRFLPTKYLKNRWRSWEPRSKYGKIPHPATAHQDNATPLTTSNTGSTSYAPSSQVPTSSTEVDRRASVRSIMTLPPYRYTPHPSEQLIAREGERAGVDTVVEYPESETEVEARREEEMEALFAVRQARRREAEEREERRQQRREARERGDTVRLAQLEQESQARARARSDASQLSANGAGSAANSITNLQAGIQTDSAFLIAELASLREAGSRSRRVSSVSYADLGLARHDGSRIRADSVDSDRPLLDSAASMGGSRGTSRQGSLSRRRPGHMRGASGTSVSIMTVDSDAGPRANSPGTSRRESDENPSDGAQLTPTSSAEGAPVPIPSTEPPSYEAEGAIPSEEAPPYESPVRGRGEGAPGGDSFAERMDQRAHHEPNQNAPSGTPAGSDRPSRSSDSGRPASSRGEEALAQAFQIPISAARPAGRTVPQLRTSALRNAPAIQVMGATPVDSVPTSPADGLGWRQ